MLQPHWQRFWVHARTELAPPSPSQWSAARKEAERAIEMVRTGQMASMSLAEAGAVAAVAVEVACWFYLGEIIGRRSIIGYNV